VPRIARTIIPRIKKAIDKYGVLGSILRSPLLPIHLYRDYKSARSLPTHTEPSEFDVRYGVNTDGDIDHVTFLSDLEIPSANWIHGADYGPIRPGRFFAAISKLAIRFEDFVFVDLGSGKGRALLLASHYPFKRIIGVEFSPQLHAVAEKNIQRYSDPAQRCRLIESVCMDFTEFCLPLDPLVLCLNRPANEVPLTKLMDNVRNSFNAHPRQLWVIFFALDRYESIFERTNFLIRMVEDRTGNFDIYKSK